MGSHTGNQGTGIGCRFPASLACTVAPPSKMDKDNRFEFDSVSTALGKTWMTLL